MFFLYFSLIHCDVKLDGLYGYWNDSDPITETFLFFEYVNPKLTNQVLDIVRNKKVYTSDGIVSVLMNSGQIPQMYYGLLNVCLCFRYFHPTAASLKPNKRNISKINGYIIRHPRQEYKVVNDKFSEKLFSLISVQSNIYSKIHLLDTFTSDFYSLFRAIENFEVIDEKVTKIMRETSLIQEQSVVNGRIVQNKIHDLVEAVVEELQYMHLIIELGIKNFKCLLYENPFKEVYHYTDSAPFEFNLTHHDYEKFLMRASDTLNRETNNVHEFLSYRRQLSYVQAFIDINNPQSTNVIQTILGFTRIELPVSFNLYILGDINNETEKEIIYSYYSTAVTLGPRVAAKYLLDAIITRNFKKAYKKTRPVNKWENIKDLYSNQFLNNTIEKFLKYIDEKQIKKLTYNVNGIFNYKDVLFNDVKRFYYTQVSRLMQAVKLNDFHENITLSDYLMSRSLRIKTLKPPIIISESNYISMKGYSAKIILSSLYGIFQNVFSYTKVISNFTIPVIFFDHYKKIDISEMNLSIAYLNIDSSKFSAEQKQFLRIGNKPKTLIGPFIFDYILNNEEIEYVYNYINKSLCHNITKFSDNNNIVITEFVMIWRVTQHLYRIQRKEYTMTNSSEYLIYENMKNPLVRWDVVINPYSPDLFDVTTMAKIIFDNNFAVFSVLPKFVGFIGTPNHLKQRAFRVINDNAEINLTRDTEFFGPNQWAVIRDYNKYILQGFSVPGFAPGGDFVSSVDSIARVSANGYFQLTCKPSLEWSGTLEPIFPKFITPPITYYYADPFGEEPEYLDTINLLTMKYSVFFEKNIVLMVKSLMNHTKKNITLYIVNPLSNGRIPGINTVVIPRYLPNFLLPSSTDDLFIGTFKHAFADILLPANINKYMFCDQSLVFNRDIDDLYNIDLNKSNIAAPVFSHKKSILKKHRFYSHDDRMLRCDRLYYATKFFIGNLDNYHKTGFCEVMRRYLSDTLLFNVGIGYDEDILALSQLECQVYGLPAEVMYVYSITSPKFLKKSYVLFIYGDDSEENIMGRKQYNDLRDEASSIFDYL